MRACFRSKFTEIQVVVDGDLVSVMNGNEELARIIANRRHTIELLGNGSNEIQSGFLEVYPAGAAVVCQMELHCASGRCLHLELNRNNPGSVSQIHWEEIPIAA